MPKSYLSNEPAAQRALLLRFDPYRQVSERIKSLLTIGHESNKIELIVKGGTWSSYPVAYQEWFIKRCFDAANHAGSKKIRSSTLAQSQHRNEKAKCRIIGLTLETRPDRITPKETARLRMLGCTRVELGLQNTSDRILKLVERGHTAADAKRALKLLRDAGFKTDLHMMPQLPGSTPKSDFEMFEELFRDPDFRPDMIKIYPCVVTPNSELYEWHKSGKFKPYSDKKLFETLIKIKTTVPYYCRISRLIRDIPGSSIVAGNTITNLRIGLQKEMKARGLSCKCLRCREVGHQASGEWRVMSDEAPTLFNDTYEASQGTEHFLSFEDPARTTVFAFCRLRLPDPHTQDQRILDLLPEVRGAAFIRELHTYGAQLLLGETDELASQHKGLGRKLMIEAEKTAKSAGFKKMAVISGIGVREYYKKLGYRLQGSYMVKKI
jgi:elongator complex protein 3